MMRIGRARNAPAIALAAAILLVTGVPSARAQYSATVLYPLVGPTGVTGSIAGIGGGDDAGDIVGDFSSNTNGPYTLYWSIGSGPVVLSSTANPGIAPTSVSGNQIVGDIGGLAYVQNGTAGTPISLNPSGMAKSVAWYTDGTQQVGGASTGPTAGPFETGDEAYLWNGTAASGANLNPAGFTSFAFGTDGVNQVGYGSTTGFILPHAFLWSGSASYIDLNPSGFSGSVAEAVSGNEEVGYAAMSPDSLTNPANHAILWNGSAAAFTDLNPSGFLGSRALGTNGSEQIGYGVATSTSAEVAMVWDGTAASAINLQLFLPTNDTWATSSPLAIDPSGNVFGYAEDTSDNYYAVEWSPVPEPSLCGAAAIFGITLMGRRRRRGRAIKSA